MNRKQENLLMYLETCLVDHRGRVAGCKLNADDHDQIDKWIEDGLVRFGRLPSQEGDRRFGNTHWVRFRDDAWGIVAQARKDRAGRTLFVTDEKKEA